MLSTVGAVAMLAGCSAGDGLIPSRTVAGTPVAQEQVIASETGAPTQKPGPKSGQNDQGVEERKEVAPGLGATPGQGMKPESYKVARLVDPCALHSPADAARITKLIPDQIMPRSDMNHCLVELIRTNKGLPVITLAATAGADFPEHYKKRAQRQEIDGAEYWFLPPTGSDSPRDCSYVKPFGPDTGLELTVYKRDAKDTTDPCQVARDYLTAVGKWWRNPAMRSDKVSTPQIPLALADPCIAAAKVASQLEQKVQGMLTDPYTCVLQPTTRDKGSVFGGLLSISYELSNNPMDVLKGATAREYRAITVGGKQATVTEIATPGTKGGEKRTNCYVTVVVDDKLALQADQSRPDTQKTYQVIKTMSPTCEIAQRGAETAAASIG